MAYDMRFVKKVFQEKDPGDQGMRGRYAVLALMVEEEGQASLIFEVRSERLRRQPGEICFPGGHIEPGESPLQCAVRETAEELGIPGKDIKVISSLGYEYTYTGELLHSFVGQTDAQALRRSCLNPEEVKEIFKAPLSFFLEQGPREAYDYQSYHIWGLTARVVRRLVKRCLHP